MVADVAGKDHAREAEGSPGGGDGHTSELVVDDFAIAEVGDGVCLVPAVDGDAEDEFGGLVLFRGFGGVDEGGFEDGGDAVLG